MKIIDPKKIENYYTALVERNSDFLGGFYAAVRTTSIFCLPTCSARKPKFENVEFYTRSQDAISQGFRACKRCHPLRSQSV